MLVGIRKGRMFFFSLYGRNQSVQGTEWAVWLVDDGLVLEFLVGRRRMLTLCDDKCCVSVRVGLEGTWFDDSIVVHQLITLVIWKGEEIVGFGVSDDLMSFDDLGLAQFLLRLLDFFENVLTHDVIIQLDFAPTVETKTTDFALDFSVLGFVPIILGTPDTNSTM